MSVGQTLPVPPLSKGISRCLRAHESRCHPFLLRYELGVKSKVSLSSRLLPWCLTGGHNSFAIRLLHSTAPEGKRRKYG